MDKKITLVRKQLAISLRSGRGRQFTGAGGVRGRFASVKGGNCDRAAPGPRLSGSVNLLKNRSLVT